MRPALTPASATAHAACPWQPVAATADALVAPAAVLQPDDVLLLPHHQRMVAQRGHNEHGQAELQLFYGDKEICFDEPELFAFGEMLATQSHFRAAASMGWGEPGDWPRVQGLLQQLIDEGVLRHADGGLGDDGDGPQREERLLDQVGERPSPLAPSRTDRARNWHELPGLMAELTGRPLDIGYLELVVPIFRIAHLSMDAEGRQVGESNSFPAALRVDVPTRWRACIYSGTRFQDPKPMNVSALKSMRAHWAPMMALLLEVRRAYLARCPEARAGWTVGHLERLSTTVLALPAYQLMRHERRVAEGALHPVLSSMFRVTDGLRMTMHHMLFIPFGEPTRKPDTPMSGAEVYAYAERAFSLHSEHGVCAGPRVMIEEFLSVLIDGRMPRDGLPERLDDELQATLEDIEPALDYAMLGLKAYAAVFSLWPMTMRVYEELHTIAQRWAAAQPANQPVRDVLRWLEPIIQRLRSSTHLATEAWRADREFVYGDMYAQSERALSGQPPARSLAEQLAGATPAAGEGQRAAWQRAIRARFGEGEGEGDGGDQSQAHRDGRAAFADCLWRYFARAQAVVQVACAVQQQTNNLLGRAAPREAFSVADVDIYVQLVGLTEGRVPFLLDELQRVFGIDVHIDAAAVQVEDRAAQAMERAAVSAAKDQAVAPA